MSVSKRRGHKLEEVVSIFINGGNKKEEVL